MVAHGSGKIPLSTPARVIRAGAAGVDLSSVLATVARPAYRPLSAWRPRAASPDLVAR